MSIRDISPDGRTLTAAVIVAGMAFGTLAAAPIIAPVASASPQSGAGLTTQIGTQAVAGQTAGWGYQAFCGAQMPAPTGTIGSSNYTNGQDQVGDCTFFDATRSDFGYAANYDDPSRNRRGISGVTEFVPTPDWEISGDGLSATHVSGDYEYFFVDTGYEDKVFFTAADHTKYKSPAWQWLGGAEVGGGFPDTDYNVPNELPIPAPRMVIGGEQTQPMMVHAGSGTQVVSSGENAGQTVTFRIQNNAFIDPRRIQIGSMDPADILEQSQDEQSIYLLTEQGEWTVDKVEGLVHFNPASTDVSHAEMILKMNFGGNQSTTFGSGGFVVSYDPPAVPDLTFDEMDADGAFQTRTAAGDTEVIATFPLDGQPAGSTVRVPTQEEIEEAFRDGEDQIQHMAIWYAGEYTGMGAGFEIKVPGEGRWYSIKEIIYFEPEDGFTGEPSPIRYTVTPRSAMGITSLLALGASSRVDAEALMSGLMHQPGTIGGEGSYYSPSYGLVQVTAGSSATQSLQGRVPAGSTFEVVDSGSLPDGWDLQVDSDSGELTITAPADATAGSGPSFEVRASYPNGSSQTVTVRVEVEAAPTDAEQSTVTYPSRVAVTSGSSLSIDPVGDFPEGTSFHSDGSSGMDSDWGLQVDEVTGRVTAAVPSDQTSGRVELSVRVNFPDESSTLLVINVNVTAVQDPVEPPRNDDGGSASGIGFGTFFNQISEWFRSLLQLFTGFGSAASGTDSGVNQVLRSALDNPGGVIAGSDPATSPASPAASAVPAGNQVAAAGATAAASGGVLEAIEHGYIQIPAHVAGEMPEQMLDALKLDRDGNPLG